MCVYQGRQCPIGHAASYQPCFDAARRLGANGLMGLRYHPHDMPSFTVGRYARFQHLRRVAQATDLPLQQHLTIDVNGAIISWKHWGQPGVSGVSSLLRQSRCINSTPLAMALIAMMISG